MLLTCGMHSAHAQRQLRNVLNCTREPPCWNFVFVVLSLSVVTARVLFCQKFLILYSKSRCASLESTIPTATNLAKLLSDQVINKCVTWSNRLGLLLCYVCLCPSSIEKLVFRVFRWVKVSSFTAIQLLSTGFPQISSSTVKLLSVFFYIKGTMSRYFESFLRWPKLQLKCWET